MRTTRIIVCKYCGKELVATHGRQFYHGSVKDKKSCAYIALRERSKLYGRNHRVLVYKNPSRTKNYEDYLKDKAKREGKPFVKPKPDPFY